MHLTYDDLAAEELAFILDENDDVIYNSDVAMGGKIATAESEALELSSITDVRRRPDWSQWARGIREELDTLKRAGTWELVDPQASAWRQHCWF